MSNKNNKSNLLGVLAIPALILVILALFTAFSYNSMMTLEEDVNSQWAQVENQLKRRADLLPNLVETVKGYASHESEVIQGIADARKQYDNSRTPEEYAAAEKQLNSSIKNMNVMIENYPDLKANVNFKDLQIQLEGTENRIATERMRYNKKVKSYNLKIRRFPTSIYAKMLNFEKMQYFEISEIDAELPSIKF